MNITVQQFEKLSKEEQNFRWAIFLNSNGYQKELSNDKIEELRIKYIIQKQKLKF